MLTSTHRINSLREGLYSLRLRSSPNTKALVTTENNKVNMTSSPILKGKDEIKKRPSLTGGGRYSRGKLKHTTKRRYNVHKTMRKQKRQAYKLARLEKKIQHWLQYSQPL